MSGMGVVAVVAECGVLRRMWRVPAMVLKRVQRVGSVQP